MTQRLIVHIGPRKTGTTYLQRVLQQLSPGLADAGVLYSTDFRGGNDYNHVSAVTDVTFATEAKVNGRWTSRDGSAWIGLQQAVASWDGTAIVSAEMLGGLRPNAAAAFLEGLPAQRVDVIITMRDLARILPSSWQQHVRNTHTEDYRHYLRRRGRQRGKVPPIERQPVWDTKRNLTFWRSYAYGALVRRWASLVGLDHVRVVTLPPAGSHSSALWERFIAAVDVAELPATAPTLENFIANIGSTAEEAAFLHAFNVEAASRGWNRHRTNAEQQRLLSAGFLDREDRGQPLRLPADFVDIVRDWADADRTDLQSTQVTIFGDLSDLEIPANTPIMGELDPDKVAAAGAFALLENLEKPGRRVRSRKGGQRRAPRPVRMALQKAGRFAKRLR